MRQLSVVISRVNECFEFVEELLGYLTFIESRFSGEIEEGWDGWAEDISI
jgi:hypothetical protein